MYRRVLILFAMTVLATSFAAAQDAAKIIVLLGPPAAGKSTQGEYLSERYQIPIVSAAELAKREVGKTKKGKRNKSLAVGLSDGYLLNDELLNQLVYARIVESDALKGFILDGYPRDPAQAEYLRALLERRGLPQPTVVHLDASDETVLERMNKRKRADDKAGFTKQVLEEYRRDSGELLSWYEANGGIDRIDANREQRPVQQELDRLLGPAVPKRR